MALLGGIAIVVALIIYLLFYFTHGKYLERKVVRADASRETPAHRLYDGIDYVPANKVVLYGHHFASIAGAGPIVGPAIALGWGWLPALLWVWFGNVFVGVVHDYLALMSSVRYDGRSIGWIAGKMMTRRAFFAFNSYIWFSLLLVVAAFGFIIAALFSAVPGAGFASIAFIFIAIAVGPILYRSKLGFKGGTIIGLILLALAIWAAYPVQMNGWFKFTFDEWLVIILIYIIIAASLPVWILLQPRDYLNAYLLWVSLALGGGALIWLAIQGRGAMIIPTYTTFSANVVGGQPSPFWPTIPLVIACGALSGFHSLVGSGTSSKQLDNELHGLLVGYGGMLTEGFLSTMVIGSMSAYLLDSLLNSGVQAKVLATGKALAIIGKAMSVSASAVNPTVYHQFVNNLLNPQFMGHFYAVFANAAKWTVIPYSYAYATNYAFGLPLPHMAIFATLWITAFALTSLDTATRLGRYAWQELMEPLKNVSKGAYTFLANKWVAATILAGLGIALAWTKQFLVIWPAFAGMNQLLSSLALMTVSVWVIKVQKATALGKGLVVAPAIFMWVTVTAALIWYLAAVIPPLYASNPITASVVGVVTAVGVGLNLYLFGEWLASLRRKVEIPAESGS